jgi:hypothetical protein
VDGMQDYKLRDEIKLLYLGLSVSCVLVSVKGERVNQSQRAEKFEVETSKLFMKITNMKILVFGWSFHKTLAPFHVVFVLVSVF